MQDHKHRSNLHVHWEFVEDPNADALLRQVARLILEDGQELAPPAAVDSDPLRTLNEGVPVEEHKQTIINQ